jgi:hypothetical protein
MNHLFKVLSFVFIFYGLSSDCAFAIYGKSNGDEARDMLQDTSDSGEEDENADAVSQWGKSGNRARAESLEENTPLVAIEESSFSVEKNRAPASMSEGSAPAKPVVAEKKPLPAAKTMQRVLREKKAHQEAALIVNDLGFFPSTLFMTQGIPVRLFVTGASKNSQCFIMETFGVRRQIRNNKVEEVTFTPERAGKYAFSCPMNGAKGTLVVKELEVLDRFPAAEENRQSMIQNPNQGSRPQSMIQDSDFGIEFRAKR